MTTRDKPLRVLHVITGLGPGGAETVLYRLTTGNSDVDHEVICLEGRDWYSDKLEQSGIPVHHINWSEGPFIAAAVRLHRLIRGSSADVVQAWMYRSNLFAGLFGRIAGKPVVWNIRHSSVESLRPLSRCGAYVGGALTRWLTPLVVNCSHQSQRLHARWGYGGAEGIVIPNGYDPAQFFRDDEARLLAREAMEISRETFLIGTVARWHAQKGIPILLRAVCALRERGVPVQLLLAGRGLDSSNAHLASMIAQSGCADVVHLLGERSDIPDIARALDLHVLPSIGGEGFPNVVAETMLSETPNVSTNVGDAALIVGDTGWIVLPGDVEQLAAAISEARQEWQGRRDEWEKRRERARERIARKFSLEQMRSAYEDVWRRVVTSFA